MAFDLIPQPKTLTVAKGGFTAGASAKVVCTGQSTMPAAYLAESVYAKTAFDVGASSAKGGKLVLWLSPKEKPAALVEAAARALDKAPPGREAYGLAVSNAGLAAVANAEAGLFYAAVTAAQLLEKRDARPFLPACTIADWPDLEFRGVHVDLKHHMERYDYLVEMVRRLAHFKINALVLELEDKFLYERHPDISAPLGLSADDLRSLVAVCREFNISLVPLVQGLGHVSYILKHPRYARLREKKDNFAEFCPQAPGAYKILFDLYEEVAAATRGTKYFHIGGDEAWLMGGCPRCAKAIAKSGKFALYQEWLDKCARKVKALGRVPMVWDDMLIKNAAGNWGELPKDLFYVRWNYHADAAARDADKIRNYAATSLQVVLAASTQTDGPYVPMYHEHLANIDGYGKAAAAGRLFGILTTTWEDSGNHTEAFWPGFAATGQAGWNSSVDIDYDFLVKFTRAFHGTQDGKLAAVYRQLGESAMKCFRLLTPEEPYRAENMIALPALAPAPRGNRWRDANAARIAEAAEMAAALREARKVLSAEILSGKRDNSYALEVLLSATRLMLARVDLFFALRDAELSVEDAYASFEALDGVGASRLLHDASVALYDALAAGEGALSSLESVWLRGRMPQDMSLFDAPGRKYLHDFNNYGHLAAKTKDLGYLLFVERRIGAAEMAGALMKGSREVLTARVWPMK